MHRRQTTRLASTRLGSSSTCHSTHLRCWLGLPAPLCLSLVGRSPIVSWHSIRHNRAAFASKGAVDFMHHVIKNFGAPGQPHATAMVLHMAKTMVQLVCVPDAVSTVAEHPKFMECWNVFSMHDDQQVRLRAAKILNKVLPASNAMYVLCTGGGDGGWLWVWACALTE